MKLCAESEIDVVLNSWLLNLTPVAASPLSHPLYRDPVGHRHNHYRSRHSDLRRVGACAPAVWVWKPMSSASLR